MKMRRAVAGVALAMVLGLGGPAGGYEVVEVKDGGTLTGLVKFVGDPPKPAPIPVRKDREACGDSKLSEALVLWPDKRVKHAVVWIEGITRGKKIEAETTLDNTRCVFVPHVLAAVVAGRTTVTNSDPILHNTHGFLDGVTVFNLALPNQNQVIDIARRLKNPGVVDVRCDAHPHMRAWMIVRDNPYVAVTDENGSFKIADIPPGTYRVVAWHESWKIIATDTDGHITYDKPVTITRDVTIPGKGEAKIEFELK